MLLIVFNSHEHCYQALLSGLDTPRPAVGPVLGVGATAPWWDRRATFIQTYIAMLRDREAKPEHSEIVLKDIFRPATEGLLNADHGPLSAADLLNKAIGGRS